ncbi:Fibronectin type-III domain-containing protein [Aphelenchoides besseyi]|nr:Fibronectin type-III domain-containing protein [Aphelenchoides besseyi]
MDEEETTKIIPAKWNRITVGAGPEPIPRHGHRAVAIKDFIVVFGGGNEGIVNDLYVFNTTNNLWYKPSMRGDLPPGLAAFGMCTDGVRIFIFGGMVDRNVYSNDLYELDARRWEYRLFNPRTTRQTTSIPPPRFAHSFNIDSEGTAYVFGGMTIDPESDEEPRKLNDFYRIKLQTAPLIALWEEMRPQSAGPSPRESHSAVIYESDGQKQLFIYGGMDGKRRLDDIWCCDLHTFQWQQIEQSGIAPLGRSLHTANIIGDRMFIFGGWVPMHGEQVETEQMQWKCSNDLAAFNLQTLTWEKLGETELPKPRAGHCAAVVYSRLYVWSGRDGIRRLMNQQLCCKDMLMLETEVPAAPSHLQLIRASLEGVELQWTPVPTADEYRLQTRKLGPPEQPKPKPVAAVAPLDQQETSSWTDGSSTEDSPPKYSSVNQQMPNNILDDPDRLVDPADISLDLPPIEEEWHDVAMIKGTTYKVTHYFIDNNTNEAERRKAALQPGVQYKFRLAGVNSVGQGEWSNVSTFRTCIPGFPGAPSSIKISKAQDCAVLNWAAPSVPNGSISEYSVYLAMRGATDNTNSFMRVYAGPEPRCTVENKALQRAHVEASPKPAVIFRIAARNEKGYGPATQVRWLQDNWSTGRNFSTPSPATTPYAAKRLRLD